MVYTGSREQRGLVAGRRAGAACWWAAGASSGAAAAAAQAAGRSPPSSSPLPLRPVGGSSLAAGANVNIDAEVEQFARLQVGWPPLRRCWANP